MNNNSNISSNALPVKDFSPFEGYFSQDDIAIIIHAFRSTGLSYREVRELLFAGIGGNFFDLLSDTGSPLVLLSKDMRSLNLAERLRDGTVPLVVWLKNAARLTAGFQASNTFEQYENRLSSRSSGVPTQALGEDVKTALLRRQVIIGQDDSLPIRFLIHGVEAASVVAKIFVPRYEQGKPRMVQGANPYIFNGTAWLVAPDIVMTNHHVINARQNDEPTASLNDFESQASNAWLEFDFNDHNVHSEAIKVKEVLCSDETLDFALLRLQSLISDRRPLPVYTERIDLADEPKTVAANIIQHPQGKPKRVAIRNNLIFRVHDQYVEYFSDTDEGSSGSPVCDDLWRVIALHQGAIFIDHTSFQGRTKGYINQGIQMTAIFDYLKSNVSNIYEELLTNIGNRLSVE